MKKISTVAVKQMRNISEQKLTIGLDLGDRSSWYCVLDEAGEVRLEQKLGTTPKAMNQVFGGMPRSRIALETGMHSPWVSRLLNELGHEVIVAHARNVRLIGESRKKDDRLDAQTLARLARIDPKLLCPVKHRSAKAQADLTVIRARAGLVRARTALVNTARGLAKSYGERLRGCNVRNMNPEKAQGLSPELRTALEPLLAGIESRSERIRECNEGIDRLAQESYPQVAELKQVKGVGTLIALTFLLTLEDAHRFHKSRDVGCYLGLQPGRRNSGQSEMEPRSINRWQHRLKREHPTCTERTKSLIEECGWKGGDSGDSAGKKQRDQQIPKPIPLTPTGLLMGGVYTHCPPDRAALPQ
jgi:transposase